MIVHLCCQLPDCKFTGFQICFPHSNLALRERSSATNKSDGQIKGQRLYFLPWEIRRQLTNWRFLWFWNFENHWNAMLVAFTCCVISLRDFGHLAIVSNIRMKARSIMAVVYSQADCCMSKNVAVGGIIWLPTTSCLVISNNCTVDSWDKSTEYLMHAYTCIMYMKCIVSI